MAPSDVGTAVGWQGISCLLPPEWTVTGFSMERESGYLRVDAPGNSTLTVQLRWMNAANPQKGAPNLYSALAPRVRRLLRKPEPPVPKPDLKAALEKVLRETAKLAKKSKAAFESNLKPEKSEGEREERTAINFTWTGAGRGQGKIWHCAVCNRVVIAQVVGLPKDQAAMAQIASQLFATLRDHSEDGYDRWALYDLQAEIPEDFRLESQKLLSGYLNLTFARGAERIVLERWGLANITLKKFTPAEWLRNHALTGLKRLPEDTTTAGACHPIVHYAGPLSLSGRARAFREAKASLRRFPTQYEGGIWECAESNKLYAVQALLNRRSVGLWAEVVSRCVCH